MKNATLSFPHRGLRYPHEMPFPIREIERVSIYTAAGINSRLVSRARVYIGASYMSPAAAARPPCSRCKRHVALIPLAPLHIKPLLLFFRNAVALPISLSPSLSLSLLLCPARSSHDGSLRLPGRCRTGDIQRTRSARAESGFGENRRHGVYT